MRKNLIFSLAGATVLATTPVFAIVSCSNKNDSESKINLDKYQDLNNVLYNQNPETYSKTKNLIYLNQETSEHNKAIESLIKELNSKPEKSMSVEEAKASSDSRLKSLNEKDLELLFNLSFSTMSNSSKVTEDLASGESILSKILKNSTYMEQTMTARNEVSIKDLKFNNSDHTNVSFKLTQSAYYLMSVNGNVIMQLLNSITYDVENLNIESFAWTINGNVLPSIKISDQQNDLKITVD